jgi:hypothetical protein
MIVLVFDMGLNGIQGCDLTASIEKTSKLETNEMKIHANGNGPQNSPSHENNIPTTNHVFVDHPTMNKKVKNPATSAIPTSSTDDNLKLTSSGRCTQSQAQARAFQHGVVGRWSLVL